MGNLFAGERPISEVVRENQRLLRRATRELEREINTMRKTESRLIEEIRQSATKGQTRSARILAKDLVRNRKYQEKFLELKAHLTGVSLKLQTVKSHHAMSEAMRGVTKAMTRVNNAMKMPELTKIMAEFARENERAEIMQEVMGDAIDDALDEEGQEEEEERVVNQILDEIGVNLGDEVPEAGSSALLTADGSKEEEKKDEEVDELEARLNNLRRG